MASSNIPLLAFNHDGNLGQAGAGLLLQGGLVLPDSYVSPAAHSL